MATTNIQSFPGDVDVTSNLTVDTNTLHVDSVTGNVGIGTTSPSAQLTLGASSGSQIQVTNNTRLLSNTHYLNYGTDASATFEQVLLQFDTGGTGDTDQSEYAGYMDVEMVAQRTQSTYNIDAFTARLNYMLGWNEQSDTWQVKTFIQENTGRQDEYRSLESTPVFKYKYVDRQLQIYVSFDARQCRSYTSFTARVTSDNPADVSMPGADALMASGTEGTAEVGICYGVGTNAANVGIGTAAPATALHVRNPGGADIASSIIIQPASTTYARGYAKIEAYPDAAVGAGTGLKFYTRLDSGSDFDPASLVTERMTIKNDGNVGIGTDSPTALTHIGKLSANSGTHTTIPSANIGVSANFPDSTHLWLGNHSSAEVEDYWGMALGTVYAGSSYIQTLDKSSSTFYNLLLQPNGGSVGIGTDDPTETLDVNGTLRVRGATTLLGWQESQRLIMKYDDDYRQGIRFNASERIMKLFSTTNDSGGAIAFHTRYGTGSSDTDYGTERMRIDSSGNVGIGSTNPTYKLNVLTDTNYDGISLRDSTRELLKLAKGDNGAYINMFESSVSKVNIATSGDSWLNGGNVGIGTDSPTALTHIGKLSANSGTHTTIPSANIGVSANFPDSTHLWLGNHSSAEVEDYWGMALGTVYAGSSYIQTLDKSSSTFYNLLLQPNGGSVGIGTTSPKQMFEVDSSGYGLFSGRLGVGNVLTSAQNGGGQNHWDDGTSAKLVVRCANNANKDATYANARAYAGIALVPGFDAYDTTNMGLWGTNSGENPVFYIQNQVNNGNNGGGYIALQPVGGSVGIGTTNPVAKLQVAGKSVISENISYQDGTRIYDADLSVVSEIGYSASGTADIDIGATTSQIGGYTSTYRYKLYTDVASGTSKFKIASVAGPSGTYNGYGTVTDRITLDNTGNVGIGTTSPNDKVEIYGATYSTLKITTDTGQAQLLLSAGATTRRACRIDFSRADTGTQYMNIIGDYQQNATDDLTVSSSTSGRIMTWLQNGNIGIGTTSPLHKLVVYDGIFGISPAYGALGRTSELAMYGTFGVNSGTGDTGPRRAADITSGFNSGAWGYEYMAFHVGRNGADNDNRFLTNERMRIDSSGRLGIGTTNPLEFIDIKKSSSDNFIRIQAGGASSNHSGIQFTENDIRYGWRQFYDAHTDNFIISTQNLSNEIVANVVTMTYGGNVGIGTTNPGVKLDVNGNARASKFYLQESTVTINNDTTTTVFTMANGQSGIISAEGDNSMYAAAFFQYNSSFSGYNFYSLGTGGSITTWTRNGANIWLKHNKGFNSNFKVRVTIF